MSLNISELAQFATANNYARKSSTPSYELGIEEAREAVKIKDGNRVKSEDGSQALVLTLGRITLALDVISKGATRVNATADQVEGFTATLQEAVDSGAFDTAIVEAQAKGKEAAERARANANAVVEVSEDEAPAGVDVDELG